MTQRPDFWSRRKQAVEAETIEDRTRAEEAETRAKQAELEAQTDAEILEQLGLPDPDTLQPGQDISGFMQKFVPERLRQRALRQLWRLNPKLANLDGLCDYDDDFTNAATDAPGVTTAYRVGRGLLKHIEALAHEEGVRLAMIETGEAVDTAENLSDIADAPLLAGNSAESVEIAESVQDYANAAPASATKVGDTLEYPETTPLDTLSTDPAPPRRMRFRRESESR
ncbi:DUF3306 domain-containing protein [Marivita sp. S2033]|uniref:DUF3306 domain-containing protein n=1 Tax=Marivita sp. S2033 TaxID=3373187 RepID=UPI003982356A